MAHKQWISPCMHGQPLDRDWTEYVREIRDGYKALVDNYSPEGVSNFIRKYAAPGSDYERLQGADDTNSRAVLSAWIDCLSYLQNRAMNDAETEEERNQVVRASDDLVALLRGELQTGDVIPGPLMFRASEAGDRLEREMAGPTRKRKRPTESGKTKSSRVRSSRVGSSRVRSSRVRSSRANGGRTKGGSKSRTRSRSRSRRRSKSRTMSAGSSKPKNCATKTARLGRARAKWTRSGV